MGEGILSEPEIDSVAASAKKEILDAVEYAKNSAAPAVEELWKDVYVEG